jgi:hypothetical protein
VPRRDLYRNVVRNALVKEGWTITHDPYPLRFGEQKLYVDLGAEMPIAAERGDRKIAVETKSFVGESSVADLQRALGQYVMYRFLVARQEPERVLFLAVTQDTYGLVLNSIDARDLLANEKVRLIVVEPNTEVVAEWIE